jgi:hypothetical protein
VNKQKKKAKREKKKAHASTSTPRTPPNREKKKAWLVEVKSRVSDSMRGSDYGRRAKMENARKKKLRK